MKHHSNHNLIWRFVSISSLKSLTIKHPLNKQRNQLAKEKKTDLVDFELVLIDSTKDSEEEHEFLRHVSHEFVLNDQAIMPFDARHFSQRLRRKVETAEQVISDTIDIPTMIESFVEKKYIDDIVYEFADASHSNIVLFSDQFGSMFAFDYLHDHFRNSLKQIPYCRFEHYSFHQVPRSTEDQDHYIFNRMDDRKGQFFTEQHEWNANTWFFIISDAGALSGIVEPDLMKTVRRFYNYLKQISDYVQWINPVRFKDLNDCSAKRLQMTIPMIYPDTKHLNKMIKKAKAIA